MSVLALICVISCRGLSFGDKPLLLRDVHWFEDTTGNALIFEVGIVDSSSRISLIAFGRVDITFLSF